MSVFTISSAELDIDLEWLFKTVTDYLDILTRILTLSEVSVPFSPKHMFGYFVPYHFAGRILILLEFARGKKVLNRQYTEEAIHDFATMMSINVMTFNDRRNRDDDDDDDDDDGDNDNASQNAQGIQDDYDIVCRMLPHVSAEIIIGAYARALINENKWLNAYELSSLTGCTHDDAKRLNIAYREDNGHMIYSPEDIKKYLTKLMHTNLDE